MPIGLGLGKRIISLAILIGMLFAFQSFYSANKAKAQTGWTPPIGIPAPSFGINEVAPAYNQSNAKHYYVRQGTGCNDSNNLGRGSSTSPRCTIPDPIGAGSLVVVEGTYSTDHINFPIDIGGTLAEPVFIKGVSNTQRATLTRGLTIQGSYFFFEYFNGVWTNASPGKIQMYGDHGVLRHNNFRGDPAGGMSGVGGVVLNGHSHVVWDNIIHYAGDYRLGQTGHPCGPGVPYFDNCDQDVHGINVSREDENGDGIGTAVVWIVDNDIAYASGDGVQIAGGTTGSIGDTNRITNFYIFIGRNKSHHNKQTGLWTKQAKDVIFSQNEVYGHRASASSPGGGGLGFQYGPERVWIMYNHIYDNETGIGTGSDSNPDPATCGCVVNLDKRIFIFGNVIHNIHATNFDSSGAWIHGAMVLVGGVGRYTFNNTIYDVDRGIYIPGGGTDYLANNIISNVTHSLGQHLLFSTAVNLTNSNFQNNIFYQNGQPIRIKYGTTAYSDLAGFQAAFPGKADGSLKTNPLFVNASGNDFSLQSTSPAINAGIGDTSLATGYQQAYTASIMFDYAGNPRPVGNYDIGAYEFQGGGSPAPVVGDINLDHIVNSIDYSIMNTDWFTTNSRSDLNRDGLVNAIDYSLLNANWFRTW